MKIVSSILKLNNLVTLLIIIRSSTTIIKAMQAARTYIQWVRAVFICNKRLDDIVDIATSVEQQGAISTSSKLCDNINKTSGTGENKLWHLSG